MSKQPQLCDLPGNGKTHGLCCTSKQDHVSADFVKTHGMLRSKDGIHMEDMFREASMEFKMMLNREKIHRPVILDRRITGPDHFHQMVFG